MRMEVFDPGFVLALSASAGQATNPLVQLIPFALVLAIFYFIILLPMRRRQKKLPSTRFSIASSSLASWRT